MLVYLVWNDFGTGDGGNKNTENPKALSIYLVPYPCVPPKKLSSTPPTSDSESTSLVAGMSSLVVGD